MPRLIRRPLVIWLLAALAVPVLLTAVLIPARAGTTEDDLRERTVAALKARGIESTTVDFDGRDAHITVPAGVDAAVVRQVAAGVDGVRSVEVSGGQSGTPTSTPTPAPTSAPVPSSAPQQADVPAFEVGRTDRSIRVQVPVRSQAVKDQISTEVQQLLGADREYDDRTTIAADGLADASTLSALLRALAIGNGDASVRYDGHTVTLSGQVPDQATRATVGRAAATAVPGAVVADQLVLPAPRTTVSEPCRTFASRLAEFGRVNRINFLSGTSIVNDASKPVVAKAAVLLKSCTTARVELAGHTDNLGSPATSLPLSERRAAEVKAELVRLGVNADRLVTNGYGESFPIASNTTAAGRIANRRVEIRPR